MYGHILPKDFQIILHSKLLWFCNNSKMNIMIGGSQKRILMFVTATHTLHLAVEAIALTGTQWSQVAEQLGWYLLSVLLAIAYVRINVPIKPYREENMPT